MAASQPKQFLELNGLPILIHSLRAFASVPRVTAIYGIEIGEFPARIAEVAVLILPQAALAVAEVRSLAPGRDGVDAFAALAGVLELA